MTENFASNILLVLYISVYIFFYLKLHKHRQYFGPTSLTLLVYAICGICSIIVYNSSNLSNLYEGYGTLTFFPFIYLALIVLLL